MHGQLNVKVLQLVCNYRVIWGGEELKIVAMSSFVLFSFYAENDKMNLQKLY